MLVRMPSLRPVLVRPSDSGAWAAGAARRAIPGWIAAAAHGAACLAIKSSSCPDSGGGPDKYTLEFSPSTSVGQLSQELESRTGVPQNGQKIINRGKTLSNLDQSLAEACLKDGSKLMLIGKRFNPEEDENFKVILDVEKKVESLEKKQAAIFEEVNGIEKGYLQQDLVKDSLGSLEKRLANCHEEYVKLLEKLDSLELGGCIQAIRGKRKSVVVAIQKHLDSNDAVSEAVQKLQATGGS